MIGVLTKAMAHSPTIPDLLPIRRMEDLHTRFVGRTHTGMLFWGLPFIIWVDATGTLQPIGHGRPVYYAVIFHFDAYGTFLDARSSLRVDSLRDAMSCLQELLCTLGPVDFVDIRVRLFTVTIDDITFGLIPDEYNSVVSLAPHATITFSEPWDGEYFT